MILVRSQIAPASELPPENQITLAVERRQFLKRRWRGVAENGIEFGFDLESRLNDGGVIWHQDGMDYIVSQLPEKVYEVNFTSPAHAALVAWKAGNLHLPAEILPNAIRVLHDDAMGLLLEREGWTYHEPTVLFTPMKAVEHAP